MLSFREWLNEDYRADIKKECAKLVKSVSPSFKFTHQCKDNGVDRAFWHLAYESNEITLKIGLEQGIVSYVELEDELGNVSAKDFSVLTKKLYTALIKLSSNFKKYDLVSDHYGDDEPKTYRLESPYDQKSVFSF